MTQTQKLREALPEPELGYVKTDKSNQPAFSARQMREAMLAKPVEQELPPLPAQTHFPGWAPIPYYTADQMREYARAALAAKPVPEGWKLVPVEPTHDMKRAAIDVEIGDPEDRIIMMTFEEARAVYRSMLSAAPPASQPAEGVEPYAYAVYFPDQPTEVLVHDLDELTDDLTNREHSITKLYTTPPASQDPCKTCRGVGLVGGHMQDGSGYGEWCPDCNPEPASQEQAPRHD